MPMEDTPRKPRKRKGDPKEELGAGEATSLANPTTSDAHAAHGQEEPLTSTAASRPLALGEGVGSASLDDLRMLERAIREAWPLERGHRQHVVDEMDLIVTSVGDAGRKIAAARVLVMADGVNVKREANAVADQASRRGTVGTTINIIRQQVNVSPGEQLQPGLVVDAEPAPVRALPAPVRALPAPSSNSAGAADPPIDASPDPDDTSANTDGTS